MTVYAAAGATLWIGAEVDVSADLTASDFTGEAWKQVKELEGLGSFGDASSEITFSPLDRNRMQRLKGVRDGGALETVFGLDPTDPGQLAVIAAQLSTKNFKFRVVFNDAPTGGTPSERMFGAMVGSAREQIDQADSVMKFTAGLWINSNIVRVAAAEA